MWNRRQQSSESNERHLNPLQTQQSSLSGPPYCPQLDAKTAHRDRDKKRQETVNNDTHLHRNHSHFAQTSDFTSETLSLQLRTNPKLSAADTSTHAIVGDVSESCEPTTDRQLIVSLCVFVCGNVEWITTESSAGAVHSTAER